MKKYNSNFTSEELEIWVENYKENNNNWSMLDFCYMDEESGDIVVQRSSDDNNPIWFDIYNEDELDVYWIGEEGCAGNYDMYIPIYSTKSGLIYFILGSQNQEYLEHKIVVLHGRKPDDDEKRFIEEDI